LQDFWSWFKLPNSVSSSDFSLITTWEMTKNISVVLHNKFVCIFSEFPATTLGISGFNSGLALGS